MGVLGNGWMVLLVLALWLGWLVGVCCVYPVECNCCCFVLGCMLLVDLVGVFAYRT